MLNQKGLWFGLGGILVMGVLLVLLNPAESPNPSSKERPDVVNLESAQFPSESNRAPVVSQTTASQTTLTPEQRVTPASSPSNLGDSEESFVLDPELSPEEQEKWNIFHEILSSQNDNDPRLDQDLGKMSPALHQNLYRKYESLAPESRNQRGLVTFLIARDLKDTHDLEFLKKVYEEGPCLSLENCGSHAPSDPHHSATDQASLNYPQLVALYQLETQIRTHPALFENSNMKDRAQAVIEQALRFPVAPVQKKAAEVDSQLRQIP